MVWDDKAILWANLIFIGVMIAAIFIVRRKYPNNYFAGAILCFLAPSLGHFYLETKRAWWFWALFGAIGKSMSQNTALAELTLAQWGIVGLISASVMSIRLYLLNKPKEKTAEVIENDDYVNELNKKLDAAGVETERDLVR